MNEPESKGAEDAARRVSACLTACKSISTKALEAGDLNVLDLQRDRMVLIQQRDTLISAFEEVLRISDRDHEAWHRARAAIAAVKGPQWRPHVWKTGGPGEGASSFLLSGSAYAVFNQQLNNNPIAENAAAQELMSKPKEWNDVEPAGPTIAQLQADGHLPTVHTIVAGIIDEFGEIDLSSATHGLKDLIRFAEDKGHNVTSDLALSIITAALEVKKANKAVKTFTEQANDFAGQNATEQTLHKVRDLISHIELGGKAEGRVPNPDELNALAILRVFESQIVSMKGGAQ